MYDVVTIKEDGMPRGSWKLARIQSLIKSDVDRISRAAALIIPSGKVLKRPYRMIYPLEGNIATKEVINEEGVIEEGVTVDVHDNSKICDINGVPDVDLSDEFGKAEAEDSKIVNNSLRQRRNAAVVARSRIHEMKF